MLSHSKLSKFSHAQYFRLFDSLFYSTDQNASVFVNETNAVFTNYCIYVRDIMKDDVQNYLTVCNFDEPPRKKLNFVDILCKLSVISCR